MFNIFRKSQQPEPAAIEPNQEEIMVLPMNISMFGWELVKMKMKLFNIHAESGRELARGAQIVLDDDPEKIEDYYGQRYSEKTVNNARKELDKVKREIDKIMQENLRLFQNANFLLRKGKQEEIDLAELHVSDEKINNIMSEGTAEDVYDRLNEYREYLDSFLDKIVNICNTLPFQLNKCMFANGLSSE